MKFIDEAGVLVGEFGLIDRVTRGIPRRKGALRLGIGDDCAVIRMPGKDLLVTTDMLIEGVHFRRETSTMRQIGRKSMLVNISDIAAMGGDPRYAVVAVGLPPRLGLKKIEELFRGIWEIAAKAGVLLIGGDTNRSSRLVINITLLGEVERGRALLRRGARVGDLIYLTGRLGDSAIALARHRHHEPPNRIPVGRFLVKKRISRSAIDISDGLLADLGHILEESRVGATVEVTRLPGKAPIAMKLTGGEDYEILFAAPRGVKIPGNIHGVSVTRIGKITGLKGELKLLGRGGVPVSIPPRRGFSHF